MRHTHGVTASPSAPSQRQVPRPRSGTSVGQVFAFVAGFVALAAIGAGIGWSVTDVGNPTTTSSSSPPVSPSTTPPTSPSVTTTSPTTPTGSVLLDYAKLETDFRTARSDLLSQRVGVVLVFDQAPPPDGKQSVVVALSPPAGTRLHPGLTVHLYISGPAPALPVPAIPAAKTKCSAWGSQLVAAGFTVAYDPTGSRSQYLWKESPDQTDTTTVWNQLITLSCNSTGTAPQPSPSVPPPPSPSTTP